MFVSSVWYAVWLPTCLTFSIRRVGFVEVQDSQKVDLPASVEDVTQYYEVAEKVSNAPQCDFMWSVVAEEAREKQFAHRAITAEVGDMPPAPTYELDWLYVADAAVKVSFFATPWDKRYNH